MLAFYMQPSAFCIRKGSLKQNIRIAAFHLRLLLDIGFLPPVMAVIKTNQAIRANILPVRHQGGRIRRNQKIGQKKKSRCRYQIKAYEPDKTALVKPGRRTVLHFCSHTIIISLLQTAKGISRLQYFSD